MEMLRPRNLTKYLLQMNIEEFDEFIEVRSKKKRNVKRVEPLNLEEIKLR